MSQEKPKQNPSKSNNLLSYFSNSTPLINLEIAKLYSLATTSKDFAHMAQHERSNLRHFYLQLSHYFNELKP